MRQRGSRGRRYGAPLAAVLAALAVAPLAAAQEPAEALPEGEGRPVVQALCGACHSLRLVTQQGMSRTRWEHTLDWMVAEQGMGELPPDLEATVLDYLAAHFGEGDGAAGGDAPLSTLSPAPAPPPPPPPS
ncbi:MAG: hypothetical protein RID91_08735 [Azospirillaceae bacterium]